MSKDGSEDVVVQQPGQEEGPATGMSPSPGIGAVRIRHILERAPQFAKEYRDLLMEASFDTLESLTLPYSEFREEVQGMKPGHARALLTMVAEETSKAPVFLFFCSVFSFCLVFLAMAGYLGTMGTGFLG